MLATCARGLAIINLEFRILGRWATLTFAPISHEFQSTGNRDKLIDASGLSTNNNEFQAMGDLCQFRVRATNNCENQAILSRAWPVSWQHCYVSLGESC